MVAQKQKQEPEVERQSLEARVLRKTVAEGRCVVDLEVLSSSIDLEDAVIVGYPSGPTSIGQVSGKSAVLFADVRAASRLRAKQQLRASWEPVGETGIMGHLVVRVEQRPSRHACGGS